MSNQMISVKGIVLKETKTKESDKIITVLTDELGVISIYAKGAMRLKNKFHSATSIFVYSEFLVYSSSKSKLYKLNEANIINVFYKLGEDIEKLSLAYYFSEITTEVIVPNEQSKDILRLFLNILHYLTTDKWSKILCKAAFEMRILCDVGYRPNLIGCIRCQESEKELYLFNINQGQIVCKDCYNNVMDYENLICDKAVLIALRYFAYADLDKMFSFNLENKSLENLSKLAERYTLFHTKHNYKTLDFLKSLGVI